MENLDVKTLFLAVTGKQAESILNGSYAMPEETSGRFGLRSSKMEAVSRSQYFHEWHLQTYGQGEPLKHKDFVVVMMKITAHGFLSKMCGEIFHKSAKDHYQWYGGLQLKETLEDGRVLYELTNFEKIN